MTMKITITDEAGEIYASYDEVDVAGDILVDAFAACDTSNPSTLVVRKAAVEAILEMVLTDVRYGICHDLFNKICPECEGHGHTIDTATGAKIDCEGCTDGLIDLISESK